MVKKVCLPIIILLLFILSFSYVNAQSDSLNAPYLKYPIIPDFTITKCTDSTLFSKSNLKKHLRTIFIVFNPECEFCQHETRDLLKNISRFKKTQIVMVSFMNQKQINDFYVKYKIANYPIITMGRDLKFFFLKFYRMKIIPSTFVYDEHGNFKKAFHQMVDMNTLLKELQF